MAKYKVGDKVVIRKDLVANKWYGNWCWSDNKEYMKELEYVTIKEVDVDGAYKADDYWITDEMIEGLYQETDISIENVSKYLEKYFNKGFVKIENVIEDSKSYSYIGEKEMNNYKIQLQSNKVKVNNLLLELLKLDHELKSMVNYK